jgi:hypothetical protein
MNPNNYLQSSSGKFFDLILGFMTILMIFMLVASFTFAKPKTQITLSYLAQTNETGHAVAFFTISNAGNVSVTCLASGNLYIQGHNSGEHVTCRTKIWQLQPSKCDIAKVYLPNFLDKPWRFTIYYSKTATVRLPRIYYTTSDWIH